MDEMGDQERAGDDVGRGCMLAIDLGLRTGLALYGRDGKLRWYRSHHFRNRAALKRGVYQIMRPITGLEVVVMEGDKHLAQIWGRLAAKWGAQTRRIDAACWREVLLDPCQQRSGADAKAHADSAARELIAWSGLSKPTALRHDTAEAILIGAWGALEYAWIERSQLPL